MSIPVLRPSDGSTVSISVSGTSAQSSALSGVSGYVRLFSTTMCHVRFGSNPTATTSNMPIGAFIPEYFAVLPGTKIAAIQSSAAGTLYITEMTT